MAGRPQGWKQRGSGKKRTGDQRDPGGPSNKPEDQVRERHTTAEEAIAGTPIFLETAAVEIPSEAVTKSEDASLTRKLQALTLVDDAAVATPFRPGYGNMGDKIVLRTNYFEIKTGKDLKLCEYSVKYEPVETVARRRKRLVNLILRETPFCNHKFPMADNGSSVLISTEYISMPPEEPIIGNVRYFEPDQKGPTEHSREFTYTVSLLRTWDAEKLKLLKSSGENYAQLENKAPFLQVLNVIMANMPSKNDKIATSKEGNKFFPFRDTIEPMEDLGGGLIGLRGYFTSVRFSTARLLLNINSITGVFQRPGSLVELFEYLRRSHPGGSLSNVLHHVVKSMRIEIRHLMTDDKKPRKARKTVFGLATEPRLGANADETSFLWKKEHATKRYTVREYFRKQYSINLKCPYLPVVNVGNEENPVYLPPEVCYIVPGQSGNKKLTAEQTAKLIKIAVRPPAHNARLMVGEGAELMGIGSDAGPKLFGLDIKPRMVTVHGRILRAPRIQYKDPKPIGPYPGAWNLSKSQFCSTPKLTHWAILKIVKPGDGSGKSPDELATQLCAQMRSNGILFDKPLKLNAPVIMANSNLKQTLEQSFTNVAKISPKTPIIFVMLPDDSSALYSTVKHTADVVCGVHTICMLTKKLSGSREEYLTNILHKVNLKNGGDNQRLPADALDARLKDKCMIVGIDVTHPSPGSRNDAPSIAGVVASTDSAYCQYLASVRVQEQRKEMVTDLEEMMAERLAVYARRNRAYPARVIVYRDGVSEGQYELVLRLEIPAISRALAAAAAATNSKPARLTVLVVGKRHHTRFYPTRAADADARAHHNCRPGTLVDRGVTGAAGVWDFFLQAHAALQGAARPAHYVVLRDDNAFGADALHALTHALCYLFARATKAVSVCPPAYYADIVCERARCYMFEAFNRGDDDDSGAAASGLAERLGAPGEPGAVAADADAARKEKGKQREGQLGPAGGPAGTAAAPVVVRGRWDGRVHPRLQDTMFYI